MKDTLATCVLIGLTRIYRMPREPAKVIRSPVADNLERMMAMRGLNPHSLGLRAGLSGDGVRNILRGKSASPKHSTISILAEALDVSVTQLIGDAPLPSEPQIIGRARRRAVAQPPIKSEASPKTEIGLDDIEALRRRERVMSRSAELVVAEAQEIANSVVDKSQCFRIKSALRDVAEILIELKLVRQKIDAAIPHSI